jgi:hypothetical protein
MQEEQTMSALTKTNYIKSGYWADVAKDVKSQFKPGQSRHAGLGSLVVPVVGAFLGSIIGYQVLTFAHHKFVPTSSQSAAQVTFNSNITSVSAGDKKMPLDHWGIAGACMGMVATPVALVVAGAVLLACIRRSR